MKQVLKNIFLFLVIGLASGALFGVLMFLYFSMNLPKIDSLADYNPPVPSKILSQDGSVLASLGREDREVIPFNEIPEKILNAFLAAEDDNFFEHSGVDYLGVLRATLANIKAGKVVQGGSTITQQVAKSLLLSRERSISRKIKDFILAQRIEKRLSKEDILYLYLNQVYLGGGYYGVKSAFRGYFGKELSEASIAETAIIAGLLVAPGKYSPYRNPKYAKTRQRYVLGRLLATGKITKEEHKRAVEEKIKYQLKLKKEFKAAYFTEWIRQRIVKIVGEDEFLTGGYTVQTTLDLKLQEVAERESMKGAREIDRRQGYRGHLGNIDLENLDEMNIEMRKKYYKKKSNFFILDEKLERKYEMEFDELSYEQIREHRLKFEEEFTDTKLNLYPGYFPGDEFVKTFKIGKTYSAIVTGVNNTGRLIFVDVAGVPGVIPYDKFKWAHERKISANRNFFPYVTTPSSILKPGNKILVKIENRKVGVYSLSTNKLKLKLKSSRDYNIIKKQRYLLCFLDQVPEAQAALVSMKPKTGEVVSFVGGIDFGKSKFNRAIQSLRQPGSSFKPILFAAGLENGFNPSSIIIDSPEALGGVDSSINWKPRNYDGKFKGPITYRNSLEQSRNVPMIKIAEKIGVEKISEFAKRIGFRAKLDPDLSLALGSFGVTLLDIVSTYAMFPNGGKKVSAKTIISVIDRHGNEIPFNEEAEQNGDEIENKESEILFAGPVDDLSEQNLVEQYRNPFHESLGGDQVYDKRLAYIMTNLLHGVVLHGTGRKVKSAGTFFAGKTGTTNNYVDAWFIGFSQDLVTGVWTGMDDNSTLGWGESGAKGALPIWREYMKASKEKFGEHDFEQPEGIVNVKINKKTGKILSSSGDGFLEAFVEGHEPGNDDEEDFEEGASLLMRGTGAIREERNLQHFKKKEAGDVLSEDDYYENQ